MTGTDREISWRLLVAAAARVLLLVALGAAVWGTVARAEESFDDYRLLLDTPRDVRDRAVLDWAHEDADAFARFRAHLGRGDRFALAGSEVNTGFHPLFSDYYFFPALRVATVEEANVLVVFGLSEDYRDFERVLAVGDAWLGVRAW